MKTIEKSKIEREEVSAFRRREKVIEQEQR